MARDAVELAKQKLYDTVIIDTAGRLGVDEELMKHCQMVIGNTIDDGQFAMDQALTVQLHDITIIDWKWQLVQNAF